MHCPYPRPTGTLWIWLSTIFPGVLTPGWKYFTFNQPLSHMEVQMFAKLKKENNLLQLCIPPNSWSLLTSTSALPLCSCSSDFHLLALLELPYKVTRDLWTARFPGCSACPSCLTSVVWSAQTSIWTLLASMCSIYFLASTLHSSCASRSSLSSSLCRNNGTPWFQICSLFHDAPMVTVPVMLPLNLQPWLFWFPDPFIKPAFWTSLFRCLQAP